MSASVIAFQKITQIAEWGTKVLLGDTYSFRGGNTSLSSKLKKGNFFSRRRSVAAFAISCFSLPGVGNVEKKVVEKILYVQLSQNFF